MKGLTARQEEALDYIRAYLSMHSFPPTVREIAESLGIKAESARDLLAALEKKGEIARIPGKGRGLVLTGEENSRREKLPVPLYQEEPGPEALESHERPIASAYLEKDLASDQVFAFIARSDSMREAGIIPGDICYVTRDLSALRNGSIVLVPSDEYGQLELRRYRRLPYYIELLPENVTMGSIKATSIQVYGLLIKTERFYK